MYIVLTGAKKNIGDFLITDRSEKLLRAFKPDEELLKLPHWESLNEHKEALKKAKAIIIMGGPGLQKNMYPGVYKLLPNISELNIPVIPLGIGWKGIPGDEMTLNNYHFTDSAKVLLNKMKLENKYVSVRDYQSKFLLKREGLNNVLMTGCPVWYDLDSIGKEMQHPQQIKRVVFTPAQAHLFKEQSIQAIKLIKKTFPQAELFCSFHRGIYANDEFTLQGDEDNNKAIAKEAESQGFKVMDTAFDLSKIKFYDDCDLHIGYRVHAHVYFLSKRQPSILLHEDGRGIGMSEALNILGINAFERKSLGKIVESQNINTSNKVINRVVNQIAVNKNAINQLERYLHSELDNRFARFAGVPKVIDKHFDIMKNFLINLP